MSFRKMVKRYVEKYVEKTRDVNYAVYLSPAGKGGKSSVVLSNCDYAVTVGSALGNTTFEPGTIVPIINREGSRSIVGYPSPGKTGAGIPVRQSFSSIALVITSANPNSIDKGVTTTVQIAGFGFSENTIIRAIVPSFTGSGWTIDTNVTITNQTYVSIRRIDLDILVDPGVLVDPYLISMIAVED